MIVEEIRDRVAFVRVTLYHEVPDVTEIFVVHISLYNDVMKPALKYEFVQVLDVEPIYLSQVN